MAIKIYKPYESVEPNSYEQQVFELDFEIPSGQENKTLLVETGKKIDLQDKLNMEKDTNSLYSQIDRFQNSAQKLNYAKEAQEYLRRIGINPVDANATTIDNVDAPKSLQELALHGAKLREVLEYVNSKDFKEIMNQNRQSFNEVLQEQKQEQQEQKVGDK